MKLTKRQQFLSRGLAVGALLVTLTGLVRWGIGDGFPSWRPAGATAPPHQAEAVILPALEIKKADSYLRVVLHSGTVHPRRHTMVSFQRSGQVNRVNVDEGQRVRFQQDLAELDTRHLEARQATLQARLQQAQSVLVELATGPREEVLEAARSVVNDLQEQLNAQDLRLQRSEDLKNSNAIAIQEYERELYAQRGLKARLATAQSQLDELEAGTRLEKIAAQKSLIQSMEAELQGVQYDLDDCQLRAPFDGMIVSRLVDPGAVVSAGTPILDLIDDQNLEIHVGVPQALADQLVVAADHAVFAGGQRFSAKLRTVLPQVDRDTRTSKAILDVSLDPARSQPLLAGQLATLELTQRVPVAGFWLPRLALTADHSGLWSCYTVQSSPEADRTRGRATKQSVEVLHVQDEWVFVRGTLQDGQLLIRDGMQRVVPGQAVEVRIESAGFNVTDLSAATRDTKGNN